MVMLASTLTEVIGDHPIVGSGVLKSGHGKFIAGFLGQALLIVSHLCQHARIVAGIHHDSDVAMILSCGANHGWATDIDIFNGIFKTTIWFSYGVFKGIKVHHHHIDRVDIMGLHRILVLPTTGQNATVHFRVQGLDPAVHDFRVASVCRHFGDYQASVLQKLGCTAG